MAYEFLQANSRSFTAPAAINNIPVPLSMFVRQQYPNMSSSRGVVSVYTDGATTDFYSIENRLVSSNQQVRAYAATGGSAVQANVLAPGVDQWFAATGVWPTSAARRIYADTTSGVSSGNLPGTTVNSLGIGMGTASGLGTFSGQLAEFAVWSVDLTDADIASLARGFRPFRVRPQSLLYYVPLIRDVNEVRNSIALTTSANAPVVFNHPRVY
jgi:hypothetical protein